MSFQVACLAIAGAFLAAGLLGGGLQFREFVVPAIGPRIRSACVALGLAFASGGFYLTGLAPIPDATPKTAIFRIENVLSEGQISEHVRVFVNSELVGTVYVDERFRSAAMVVPVRGEGMHSYQLVALCKYRDADGRTVEARGVASGALDVRAGSTYRLEGEIEGTRWQALIYKKTV